MLKRPPVVPRDFTYGEIRNRIILHSNDDNGTVRYAVRRKYIANFVFEIKSNHIEIDGMISKKFMEN